MENNLKKIVLNSFCFKQFDKTKTNIYIDLDRNEFVDKINDYYLKNQNCLVNGYASFCKHIFIENFTDMTPDYLEINSQNENLIKTNYEGRVENEAPVLIRYISHDAVKDILKPAKFLDVILYTKEQIQKGYEAKGLEDPDKEIDYEYGVMCIKPQNVDIELTMDPITVMRNALGFEFGGSGAVIDRKTYDLSVLFWRKNIIIK